MTAQPSAVIKQATYLGYEILVETFGPIKVEPREAQSLQSHHTTTVSVWYDGQEIREARETPALRFVTREDAAELGLEIGQMIVDQRRESTPSSVTAFKLPRLRFSLLS